MCDLAVLGVWEDHGKKINSQSEGGKSRPKKKVKEGREMAKGNQFQADTGGKASSERERGMVI